MSDNEHDQSPTNAPYGSLDHTILSSSVGVREAIPQDATPGRIGRKYDPHLSTPQPGSPRSSSVGASPRSAVDDSSERVATSSERPDLQKRAQSDDHRPGVAAPVIPEMTSTLKDNPTTEILGGLVQKSFKIQTELLVQTSPYFAALQNPGIVTTTNTSQIAKANRLSGPFSFPQLDEFALALFIRWIYGEQLAGPSDFHSMNHYLCLYVLATDFQIESLKNTVMDLVREYYHHEDMTAPAFRLDYIYGNTSGPCLMREFLIMTAAFRALTENEEKQMEISGSMKGVLKKGGDMSSDFADALIRLTRADLLGLQREDVRKGDPCRWHEHTVTPKCEAAPAPEPWESA